MRRTGILRLVLRRIANPRLTNARFVLPVLVLVFAIGCARRPLVLTVTVEPNRVDAASHLRRLTSYETAAPAVASLMVKELGLPLPRHFTVFVYPTRTAYADGLARVGQMSPTRATEIAAYSRGLGERRRVFINDEALRGVCRSVWLSTLAHELTHLAQYELSGGRRGRSEQWLREGMADWVAAWVLDRLGERKFGEQRERTLRELARAETVFEDQRLDLIELGGPRGWETRDVRFGSQVVYRFAFLLTDVLIRHHGFKSVIAYFRAFAHSDDRFNEFRRAFGVSLEEFERDVLTRIRVELASADGPDAEDLRPPTHSSHEVVTFDAIESCRAPRN